MKATKLVTVTSIKYLLNKNGWIEIPASGTSMYPLITDGDICRFEPIKEEGFTHKDILLFCSSDGQLIGHRFSHNHIHDGIEYYICKGDTNYVTDTPITNNQLIGRLIVIKKKQLHLYADGWPVRFWGWLISQFPLLPIYCKRFFWRKE